MHKMMSATIEGLTVMELAKYRAAVVRLYNLMKVEANDWPTNHVMHGVFSDCAREAHQGIGKIEMRMAKEMTEEQYPREDWLEKEDVPF